MLDFPEDVTINLKLKKWCNFQTKISNVKSISISKVVGLKFLLIFSYCAMFGNIASRVCGQVING